MNDARFLSGLKDRLRRNEIDLIKVADGYSDLRFAVIDWQEMERNIDEFYDEFTKAQE